MADVLASPAGAAFDQAPALKPYSITAVTPSAGLPDVTVEWETEAWPYSTSLTMPRAAWWKFVAPSDGRVRFESNLSLHVFTGSTLDDLSGVEEVEYGANQEGFAADVTATAGSTYWIAVYGGWNDSHVYQLRVSSMGYVGDWVQMDDVVKVWADGSGNVVPDEGCTWAQDVDLMDYGKGFATHVTFAGVWLASNHQDEIDPTEAPPPDEITEITDPEIAPIASAQAWSFGRADNGFVEYKPGAQIKHDPGSRIINKRTSRVGAAVSFTQRSPFTSSKVEWSTEGSGVSLRMTGFLDIAGPGGGDDSYLVDANAEPSAILQWENETASIVGLELRADQLDDGHYEPPNLDWTRATNPDNTAPRGPDFDTVTWGYWPQVREVWSINQLIGVYDHETGELIPEAGLIPGPLTSDWGPIGWPTEWRSIMSPAPGLPDGNYQVPVRPGAPAFDDPAAQRDSNGTPWGEAGGYGFVGSSQPPKYGLTLFDATMGTSDWASVPNSEVEQALAAEAKTRIVPEFFYAPGSGHDGESIRLDDWWYPAPRYGFYASCVPSMLYSPQVPFAHPDPKHPAASQPYGRYVGGQTLAARTTIRPSRYRLMYEPAMPTVEPIPTTLNPGLSGELLDTGARYE